MICLSRLNQSFRNTQTIDISRTSEIKIKCSAKSRQAQTVLQDTSSRRQVVIWGLRTKNQKINIIAPISLYQQALCCFIGQISSRLLFCCNMTCCNLRFFLQPSIRIFHTLRRKRIGNPRNICFQPISSDSARSSQIATIHGNHCPCHPTGTIAQKKQHHAADIFRRTESQKLSILKKIHIRPVRFRLFRHWRFHPSGHDTIDPMTLATNLLGNSSECRVHGVLGRCVYHFPPHRCLRCYRGKENRRSPAHAIFCPRHKTHDFHTRPKARIHDTMSSLHIIRLKRREFRDASRMNPPAQFSVHSNKCSNSIFECCPIANVAGRGENMLWHMSLHFRKTFLVPTNRQHASTSFCQFQRNLSSHSGGSACHKKILSMKIKRYFRHRLSHIPRR